MEEDPALRLLFIMVSYYEFFAYIRTPRALMDVDRETRIIDNYWVEREH